MKGGGRAHLSFGVTKLACFCCHILNLLIFLLQRRGSADGHKDPYSERTRSGGQLHQYGQVRIPADGQHLRPRHQRHQARGRRELPVSNQSFVIIHGYLLSLTCHHSSVILFFSSLTCHYSPVIPLPSSLTCHPSNVIRHQDRFRNVDYSRVKVVSLKRSKSH